MDNIKMKITTVQTVDAAGNEDIIELVTEASMEHEHDCIIVNYDESDITESKGTRTRLKIYKDRLIVTKVGALSSRMEFEENKRYSNLYTTPYGTFDLDFNTIAYKNELNEQGRGTISIEYIITFSSSEESYNKMVIDIF